MDIEQHTLLIDDTKCKLFATSNPEVLLIQPSARHEEKGDGISREARMIAENAKKGFALLVFDTEEWALSLMPWHDEAVARDEEVGRHSHDTLRLIQHILLPWLHARFGFLPCIIGGYSLGGLFALWAASESKIFDAVAAASPSLWIKKWGEYASTHPICAKYVYLSLGDREEHCRNQRMRQIGNCVREEHLLLSHATMPEATTLEWLHGGHFGQEPERTAQAFTWCIDRL